MDPAELRRAPRELVDFETLFRARGNSHELRIINISPLGLMGRTTCALLPGEQIWLTLPHALPIEGIVRWAEDGRVGVEFATSVQAGPYAMMLSVMPRRQTAW